jgi:NADH-quinone oxidoreductase subunit E
MLHLVQSEQGYVSSDGMAFCAEMLGITKAQVAAVATFYTMYKRRPAGDWLVSVCTNTMCGVLGGDKAFQALSEYLGVGHDETTPDGTITLEHAECLAACDLGPVLQVNYEFYDNQTPESAVDLVDRLRRGEKPAPTRGAPLSDWRTVSLELAGFYPEDEHDFRARVDGPSAAVETLRGAKLATDRGWTAPAMPDDAALPSVDAGKK